MGRPRKRKNQENPICPWSREEKRFAKELLGCLEGEGNYWFVRRKIITINESTRWRESAKLLDEIEKIPFSEWQKKLNQAIKITLWDDLYDQPILIEPSEAEAYGISIVDDPDAETEYIIPDRNNYYSDLDY